jgi:hypothetical protein
MPHQAKRAHGFRKSFKWHDASSDVFSLNYNASEKTGGGNWKKKTVSGSVSNNET